MTSVILPLLLLQAFVSGCLGFEWLPGSLQGGSTVLVCFGDSVNLTWAYRDLPAEVDINEEWAFVRRNETIESLVASVFRGHFFTEENIHQAMTYLKPSGVLLNNVTSEDDGYYLYRAILNLQNYITIHQTNVSLLVIDPRVADNKTMVVIRRPDVVYDNATGEYHVQLACSPSEPLGNMPIQVEFLTASNEVLNSTGFDHGQFTVLLPNPVASGGYSCRVSNPEVTCLPDNAPLLQTASDFVDGCRAQLDVATATLTRLQQQIVTEKEATRHCLQQLHGRTSLGLGTSGTTQATCSDALPPGKCQILSMALPTMCQEPDGLNSCRAFCGLCQSWDCLRKSTTCRPHVRRRLH